MCILNGLNKNMKAKMFISADNTKTADTVKNEDREEPQHWRDIRIFQENETENR